MLIQICKILYSDLSSQVQVSYTSFTVNKQARCVNLQEKDRSVDKKPVVKKLLTILKKGKPQREPGRCLLESHSDELTRLDRTKVFLEVFESLKVFSKHKKGILKRGK